MDTLPPALHLRPQDLTSLSPADRVRVLRAATGLAEDCAPCRVHGWLSPAGISFRVMAYRDGGPCDAFQLAHVSVPLQDS